MYLSTLGCLTSLKQSISVCNISLDVLSLRERSSMTLMATSCSEWWVGYEWCRRCLCRRWKSSLCLFCRWVGRSSSVFFCVVRWVVSCVLGVLLIVVISELRVFCLVASYEHRYNSKLLLNKQTTHTLNPSFVYSITQRYTHFFI